jgi:hypothetical protein
MNMTNLSKEKKQYLILGAIGVLALVIITIFGLKFSLSSVGEAKTELADLKGKIESAERFLAKREQTRQAFSETSDELKSLIKSNPPLRNYYSWATEIIYAQARTAGLEVDAIDEQTGVSRTGLKDEDEITLEVYALRISAQGGYEQVKTFLNQVEHDYPLVRVTGIDLSTGASKDIHNVELFVEWPFNLSEITKSWESVLQRQQGSKSQAKLKDSTSLKISNLKKVPTPPAPRQAAKTIAASSRPVTRPISRLENKSQQQTGVLKKQGRATATSLSSRTIASYGVKK